MFNTFHGDPIRRRDVRPAKSPIPERPQRDEPAQQPQPQREPEREPERVPA
jgi:hypothetical protein